MNSVVCDQGRVPDGLTESSQPLILKGLVSHWPVVEKALQSDQDAIEYILSFYQARPVSAFLAKPEANGRFFYNENFDGFNFVQSNVDLADLLNKILEIKAQENQASYYAGSIPIDQTLPGFLEQNPLDLGYDNPLKSFWLGNQTCVAAHFDFPENIACCVLGRRRFTLFPPEQLENLYIGPLDVTPAGQQISTVDMRNPDLKHFPKFQQAMDTALVADLEPGDAVFVPSMWWHQVEGFSDINGLVNFWWRETPEYLGSPTDPLLHALLGLKDLPKEQRLAWKNIFNHYVFDPPEDALAHLPNSAHGRLGPLDEAKARQLRAQLLNNLK